MYDQPMGRIVIDAFCAPEGPAWRERMRLRGFTGARDEVHLAAIVQNLKTNGAAPSRPATKGSLRGDCLRG
jgi:hypothetical protein